MPLTVLSLKPTLAQRGLHGWAILTVVASACAIALGSVVTTFRFGMTDWVWPTAPWHLFVIDWTEPSTGFLIEHAHRLAAWTAGFCFTVLAVGTFFVRTNRKLGWLGFAALGCVIIQGLLGGFRVRLDALMGTNLALIHGTFAQIVFSLGVVIALVTSPRLHPQVIPTLMRRDELRRQTVVLTLVAFGQLVWGALLRHTHTPLAQRGHLLTAFAVVAAVAWLAKTVFETPDTPKFLRGAVVFLVCLVTLQLLLGVEAFLQRFASGTLPELEKVTIGQAVVRTLHVVIGSWILATAVSCTVLAYLLRNAAAVSDEDVAYPQIGGAPASELLPASSLALAGGQNLEGRA